MTDFDYWSEINEQELTCIFAESGMDREMDFDREQEEITIFEKHPVNYNLIWRTDASNNLQQS